MLKLPEKISKELHQSLETPSWSVFVPKRFEIVRFSDEDYAPVFLRLDHGNSVTVQLEKPKDQTFRNYCYHKTLDWLLLPVSGGSIKKFRASSFEGYLLKEIVGDLVFCKAFLVEEDGEFWTLRVEFSVELLSDEELLSIVGSLQIVVRKAEHRS